MISLEKEPFCASERRAGFALVISITLVAFLLLLVVSTVSVLRQETITGVGAMQETQARQQAMLGMNLALGELQKALGPDQRVSATGDLLDNSHSSRKHALGVWASADIPSEGLAKGDFIRWLSSDATDINGDSLNDYNSSNAPQYGEADTVVLVGAGSLMDGNNDGIADDTNEQIVVEINNTTVEQNGETIGRYAWWIGDEGVKARINLGTARDTSADTDELKFRSLNAVNSFTSARPSALSAALGAVDFEEDGERITKLSQLEILTNQANGNNPNPSAGIDKQYFHHLTPFSAGVLADVKNGGLKKDLSLAFEMDDADFNASEFAGGGFDPYSPYNTANFEVQPVFTFTDSDYTGGAAFSGTANGPAWHLLRDYYRLYHEMETPMTNPTLDARVFGPNLNHSKYDLPNSEGRRQPAFMLSGGRVDVDSGWSDASSSPSDAIIEQSSDPDGPIHLNSEDGDPLRSRNTSYLTTLVSSNYMPLMIRSVGQFGVFVDGNSNTNPYLRTRARTTFVMHNPYNVSIRHDDMYVRFQGISPQIDLYHFDTDIHVPRYYSAGNEPVSPTSDDEIYAAKSKSYGNLVHHGYIETGTMTPGQITAYGGEAWNDRAGSVGYVSEVQQGTGSWTYPWRSTNYKIGERFVPEDENGAATTQFTVVARPKAPEDGENVIFSRFPNGSPLESYTIGNYETSLFLRDGSNYEKDPDGPYDIWPMASTSRNIYLAPGESYGDLPDAYRTTAEYQFPMSDPDYTNLDDADPKGWRYGFVSPIDTVGKRDPDTPVIMYSYAFQLKGSETLSADLSETNYPTYVLTNPLAPVKDNRNIFPASEVRLQNDVEGFPVTSPGWELRFQEGGNYSSVDYRFWGPSTGSLNGTSGGVQRATVLELPTAPLLSLGRLQNANVAIYDHMPAMAISNSLASPYIARDQVYSVNPNRYDYDRLFYDISYLMNEALWDSTFFSSYSIPYDSGSDDYAQNNTSVQDTFDAVFVDGTSSSLPNPRMQLILGEGEDVSDVRNKLFEDNDLTFDNSTPGEEGDHAYRRSAENLMVEGAFNINSTSVDTWRSILSGARDMAIYQSYDPGTGNTPTNPQQISSGTVFAKHTQPAGDELTDLDITDENAWNGFRSLSDIQIEELATKIVDELRARVTARGTPFLTLSEFVNRDLSNNAYGLNGLLQAAINACTTIGNDELEEGSEIAQSAVNGTIGSIGTSFLNHENLEGAQSATMGASTYLMQADILQAIGAFISTRSDSFRIRSYGECINPDTGDATAKAWCEAIVQRIPEPVEPREGSSPDQAVYWTAKELDTSPTPFGRKFRVISFRWLEEDEV
ncbi:MAG: hypothetical protein ACPGN3_17060 [Opitutales bacterium]